MTYFNRRPREDGYTFGSQAELDRYRDLKLAQSAGAIADLEVHPRFELGRAVELDGRKHKAVVYEADFSYTESGVRIVEDVKPRPRKDGKVYRTAIYKLKRHLVKDKYGVEVVEIVQ